tara:strand:- start:1470 stop:1688 length:219 start_codon:yes stop_codon:yes gene_type:complete
MVTYDEADYKDWEKFRMGKNDVISAAEFTLVCDLHSKYYKHSFYKPCTCSPKTINKWIKDLNIIWDNGYSED